MLADSFADWIRAAIQSDSEGGGVVGGCGEEQPAPTTGARRKRLDYLTDVARVSSSSSDYFIPRKPVSTIWFAQTYISIEIFTKFG